MKCYTFVIDEQDTFANVNEENNNATFIVLLPYIICC